MLILSYHRVADVGPDPWGLCVSPGHFARQMEVLRAEADPLPLAELVAAVRRGDASPRAVAVTFDDGYVDNLIEAKPILERWEVPATVFVATGYVGSGRDFWWDVVQDVLLDGRPLPPVLDLEISGTRHRWVLGSREPWTATVDAVRNWRAWTPAPTPRHALYVAVWQLLRPLDESARLAILDQLVAWAGSCAPPAHTASSPRRAVTSHEMKTLASGGLVALGAHTVTHPLLSSLSAPAQRQEIEDSRKAIEDVTGGRVSSFAYPYGDFDSDTLKAVREAGLTMACAGGPGRVDRSSDPLRLPRVQVEDWNTWDFRERLSGWRTGGP